MEYIKKNESSRNFKAKLLYFCPSQNGIEALKGKWKLCESPSESKNFAHSGFMYFVRPLLLASTDYFLVQH
jgi:hypothetical protein